MIILIEKKGRDGVWMGRDGEGWGKDGERIDN